MIIKSINIKNFRSYYGNNPVVFSDGLTLIIGGNGDGKTTFFESLEWLMNTTVDGKRSENISEKRKAELLPGESDETSVSMVFEHDGDKELVKRFRFYKNEDGSVSLNDYEFVGYDNDGAERVRQNGATMLDNCFESEIRRYCMFKGESNLNIFAREETAIKKLVETFSDIKQFDDLETLSITCENKSQSVVAKATNVNSCWYALQSMPVKCVLILGGKDKGNDYNEIADLVREKCCGLVYTIYLC